MKTGAEAIRALATQLPAFRQKLNEGWYQIRIAGRDAGETELSARLNEPLENGAVIHIVPRLAGAKSGGIFQAVLGAAVMAVAIWMPGVQLVSKMLGKELDDMASIRTSDTVGKSQGGTPVLEAQGLASTEGIKPFDFAIHKGEVNGFTGLLGSGRSESVRAIFGADRVTGGKVMMDGKPVKIHKPLDAMKLGIGYLPEDRKRDGIVGDLSVRDNIILAYQVMKGFFHPIPRAQAEKYADEYIRLLEIKTASSETPIKQLSGGNQQKVILARWLLTDPKYLILDEPTRGIDVGTKTEIQKLVLHLAEDGKSVTFISSELDEMLRTCTRLLVMRDRKMVGELTGEDLNQTKIMATIAGGEN